MPGSSLDRVKLSRWVVAKPHLSATSRFVTSSLASSSSLSLRHACWTVAVPSRRGSADAIEPSPKNPTSSPYSPTRVTQPRCKFVPQRKGRGLPTDPSQPPGWVQATRGATTATTAVVRLTPKGSVCACLCVCVYLLNCTCVCVCVCIYKKTAHNRAIRPCHPKIVILCHSH